MVFLMMPINSRNILWSKYNINLLNVCRNSADGNHNKYFTHNMTLKYIIANLEATFRQTWTLQYRLKRCHLLVLPQ